MDARERDFAGATFWTVAMLGMIVSRIAMTGVLDNRPAQILTDLMLIAIGALACYCVLRSDAWLALLPVVWFTGIVVTGGLTDWYKDPMHLLWGAAACYVATHFRWWLLALLLLALFVEADMALYDNGKLGGGFVFRHFFGES